MTFGLLSFGHPIQPRAGWNTLGLGGGGLVDGFDIAPDGTAICRCDSAFVYLFNGTLPTDFFNSAKSWTSIVNATSMGGTLVRGTSIGDAVIAYSKTTNFFVEMLNNLGVSSTSDNGRYVYYTTDSGASWTRSNLSWTGEDFQSTTRKAAAGKLAVDPLNENVVYKGMPVGNVTANITVSNGSGGAGNIISICDMQGMFADDAASTLHLWSGSGGTDYGTVSGLAATTTQTSSAMTWDISGTTLTIGGTSPGNFAGAVNQGLTSNGAAITAGTIITAVLGGNQYTVNNSQTVSGTGRLTACKATLVGTAVNLANASRNITNSILANGAVTSVFLATDGHTFAPISTSTLPQTKRNPGVCGMLFDKNSGSVVGVGGLTVTKRAIIPIAGSDIYETTDGGVTWASTGAASAFGTSGRFSTFSTTMNHSGHVFCHVVTYDQFEVKSYGIWRYSDVVTPGTWAWARISTTDVDHPRTTIWADPRSGHEGDLYSASAGGGASRGYKSVNANAAVAANVVFNRTLGNNISHEFADTYDVPYLNYGLANQVGNAIGANRTIIDDNGYCWWCGNQGGIWMYTTSDHTTPTIPDFSVSCETYSTSLTRGIENTIAEYVCRPPGSPYPIRCIQDMGLHYGSPYDNYASTYYNNAQQIYALVGSIQRTDCWNASWAPGNTSFICTKQDVGQLSAANSKQSGYSLDGGLSWTPYTVGYAESFAALYPTDAGNGYYYGGFICAIDDQHQMACSGVNRNNTPLITTDRGATSWVACGGLPSIDWTLHYYGNGGGPMGQPFAAGHGAAIGTVWAVDAATTNGTAKIYKSTDSGVNFVTAVSLGGANVTSFGSSYESVQLYSVPGFPDDLWLTARFSNATNHGIWRSTDGGLNFTKLTLPSNVTTGGKFVNYLTLGKALSGASYPTLYLLMWTESAVPGTATLYYSSNQGVTWTQIGAGLAFLDMPATAAQLGPKAIFGDWEVPGLIYASTGGGGFAYYSM